MAIERWRQDKGLRPWRPWGFLEEIERPFESFFGHPLFPYLGRRLPVEEVEWSPAVEVFDKEDKLIVKAELPGMKMDDLELTALRNRISVSGKREIPVEEASYHRREREGGTFSRSVTLPSEIDGERVGASYKDGVLTIVLPKREEAKPRQITVKTS